ncbi:MAG: hypothetical protein Kow00133_05580 [Amphiplicatus sp.]
MKRFVNLPALRPLPPRPAPRAPALHAQAALAYGKPDAALPESVPQEPEIVVLQARAIPSCPREASLAQLAAQAYRASAQIARARPGRRRLDILR